ncbi:hypothetical protein T492DRAFT_871079 [Pavlovales sp. CCMP2436]|nr:hypothetical protein T492DRAFT_871079 [Pavlovales sp. CCMP2436]
MSTPCRAYHFASTQYAAAFGKLPDTGRAYADRLRTDAVAAAVAIGDSCAAWTAEPAVTLLRGESLRAGTPIATLDAWGRTNGLLVQATAVEVNAVVAHARGYRPPATDLRASVRAIETEYLAPGSAAAAALVACQALDFGKQDGVTEMIENVEAAAVERRMADALLADELAGIVNICRAPAFVACVSNFTNFLDLSRKRLFMNRTASGR